MGSLSTVSWFALRKPRPTMTPEPDLCAGRGYRQPLMDYFVLTRRAFIDDRV
jgi:hypothetical protein